MIFPIRKSLISISAMFFLHCSLPLNAQSPTLIPSYILSEIEKSFQDRGVDSIEVTLSRDEGSRDLVSVKGDVRITVNGTLLPIGKIVIRERFAEQRRSMVIVTDELISMISNHLDSQCARSLSH